jgi:hypothetical protein
MALQTALSRLSLSLSSHTHTHTHTNIYIYTHTHTHARARSFKCNICIFKIIFGRTRAWRTGFDSRQCKMFLFPTASRPVLGPTQLQLGSEADHLPPSSADVQWLSLSLSKAPNRRGVSLPWREGGNSPSFRNAVISNYFEFWKQDNVHKPIDSEWYTSSSEPFKFYKSNIVGQHQPVRETE